MLNSIFHPLFKRYFIIVFTTIIVSGCFSTEPPPIKIAVLHSLTGTMAISEKSVAEATQMAVDEINANGGLLGRQILPIIVDGKSNWPTFALEAEKLIIEEKVSVIFGGWTSASRKIMKPVIEKHQHLLFYPVQYEGLESSPYIIYTGATPNQQITPAVKWSMDNLGDHFYLVASDYVFPRAANTIIKKQLSALGATLVGEYYLPLGSQSVDAMMNDIIDSKPDVILNTINGDSNIAFFQQLKEKNIAAKTLSFSIAEDELLSLNIQDLVNHYCAWNYFQSIKTPENKRFVKAFKTKYGSHRTTNASMEAGYTGVYLWAQAVSQAGTDDPSTVRQNIKGQSYNSPEGIVTVSAINNHLWKSLYIGQINSKGQFDIVWGDNKPIRPIPYPSYRSVESWHDYLNNLYHEWGENWAAAPDTGIEK